MSTERVVVQRGAAATLVPALQREFEKLRAGDIEGDSNAKLPALINENAAENVLSLLREAKEAGAEVLVGDLTKEGAVLQPHIISDIKPGMRAFDRESFGPGTKSLVV